MLDFLKNNIVVPQNATKATNATLCQNTLFWENRVGSHIPMAFCKYPDLMGLIFLERAMGYMNRFRPIFDRFWTRRIFYEAQNGQNPQMKIEKNVIFSNVIKIYLKWFRYRFWVQNASKTPQEPISGHTSTFRPLPANISKIEIWEKTRDFAIFC